MAFLKRKSETPVAELERELADLTARRDLLERKLSDAAGALALAVDERRVSLLEADFDDATAVSHGVLLFAPQRSSMIHFAMPFLRSTFGLP
jgi:hypothetical protein